VQGILAMGGGSGATRLLHLLDYALIRRQPKFLAGYSDVTALLNAVQARTGLVCFHSPMGSSDWNEFSTKEFRSVVMEAKPALLANPTELNSIGVPVSGRTHAIRGGTASGRLVGGNLTVLTTLLGTPYAPDFRGAILFLEDVNEYVYRIDRMLSHLKQAGAFQGLVGVVLGQFTDCKPGDDYGTLPLDDVFDDYFGALNVPVFSGSMFGHVRQKFTLPVGLDVEMVAEAGTLRLLSPAVV
jgi:muramoyltetrapeptide carboxypeptidase